MKSKIGVTSDPTKWTLVQQKLKKKESIIEFNSHLYCQHLNIVEFFPQELKKMNVTFKTAEFNSGIVFVWK